MGTRLIPFPVISAKLVLNTSSPCAYSLLKELILIFVAISFVPERFKCHSPRRLNEAFPSNEIGHFETSKNSGVGTTQLMQSRTSTSLGKKLHLQTSTVCGGNSSPIVFLVPKGGVKRRRVKMLLKMLLKWAGSWDSRNLRRRMSIFTEQLCTVYTFINHYNCCLFIDKHNNIFRTLILGKLLVFEILQERISSFNIILVGKLVSQEADSEYTRLFRNTTRVYGEVFLFCNIS